MESAKYPQKYFKTSFYIIISKKTKKKIVVD